MNHSQERGNGVKSTLDSCYKTIGVKRRLDPKLNVNSQELLASRRGYFNEPRNVAIYLIRHLRGETLKGVGEAFGINRNSTVSSVVERLNREIRRNKKIKKRVEDLKATLAMSKE